MNAVSSASLPSEDSLALEQSRHGDPFAVLGPHRVGTTTIVRAYLPGALSVEVIQPGGGSELMTSSRHGLFEAFIDGAPYRLRIHWPNAIQETADPYSYGLMLSDFDLHLFSEGRHFGPAAKFGANLQEVDGVAGVLFAVWAPNARAVSVVGDFNGWDARRYPMRLRGNSGVWEFFVPGVAAGATYKFAIVGPTGEYLPWKADPLARQTECPPKTASVVAPAASFVWTDEQWLATRGDRQKLDAPQSVYEVHVGSWLKTHEHHLGSWDEAVDRLIPYLVHMGFTHVELLPITEHPFGGSWGYQPLSLFAPTARLGSPASFARFVDRCHAAGIGVILDWVPAHFPSDEHGLARFDGTALYEHQDPREGFHQDWNTLIYNLGRSEVRGFLLSSALWWMEAFHIDGLRVDAVASMLYRDYSREPGQWIPNKYGGRENLEAVSFLQELNTVIGERCPGAITIAEESTAWPGVTTPVHDGGLGFHYKWNMGWMHDTLRFFERDPVHRKFHLDDISFGLIYAFSENFVLPLSHDEVVHGKRSLLGRMPGDDWQRFANLRLCFAMMWTHPGKKLLFMGGEFGAEQEWNVDAPYPWPHQDDHLRQGLSRLVRDLNAVYKAHPQLYRYDRSPKGFAWVVGEDPENTVFAFRRSAGSPADDLLVVANMTPSPRYNYRVGVPASGHWREIFNSDASLYGGSNLGNDGGRWAEAPAAHGQPQALDLTLPPLGLIVLKRDDDAGGHQG